MEHMKTTTGPTTGPAPAPPRLGRYEIDTSCSTVTFATRHLFGLAPVRGTFAILSGTVDIAEPAANSAVSADIDTASFSTGNAARDTTVRSPRFLDAAGHPAMTFGSERVDGRTVTGTLTVRGVTRPVSLAVRCSGTTPQSFTGHATTRIDRTEFGLTALRGLAGRYLDVTLEVRCVRK
jgi:polyisoprenoid-binding protein YceI